MTGTPSAPMPTHVNGQEVIADEPAQSLLPPKPNGEPIYLTRVRQLLLADGSTIYACAECGKYTGAAVINVVAHIRSHRRAEPVHIRSGRNEEPAAAPTVAALSSAPTTAAAPARSPSDGPDPGPTATAALRDLIADRDTWRKRAETAEKDLTELRAAIQRPAAPDHRVPPDVVAHAKERLRILGTLSRTELRAMTGLNTAGLDALTEILITEGVAKPVRTPRDRGPASVMLAWVG
jgi:hypothetical protein